MATLEEVSGVFKQMEADQITLEKTLEDVESELEHPKDVRGGEWCVQVEAYVSFWPGFLGIERDHQQMIIMHPDHLGVLRSILVLELNDLVSKGFVDEEVLVPEFLVFNMSFIIV